MKIAVAANPHKPIAVELAARAVGLLRDRAEVWLTSETQSILGLDLPRAPLEELEVDAIVAIGGDGTFLYALHRNPAPLLPINAGTVGFLAEVDGSNSASFDGAIERLLRGRYFVESRMKLASQVVGANLPDATNELVVHTSQVAKMRLFEIGVDGRPVGRIRADGVILATPTGSTSYSLSALGPILDPAVEGIVVTALAPFQVTQRAVVLDPLRTVSVRLVTPEKDGVIVIDGQSEHRLAGGATVVTYRSPRRAEFLRFGSRFVRRLQGKRILPWSEEVAEGDLPFDADLPPPA
ncbi:MAG TPA: NAD(+)/NADH kinase [Thermoplasmata archaeon]